VSRLKITDHVYALFIVYMDLSTDEYTPYLMVPRESVRREIVEREGPTDGSSIIWMPGHLSQFAREIKCEGPELRRKCQECYDLLTGDDWSGEDELDVLLPFRRSLYRVAQELNRRDWRNVLTATGDFVVVVSDWTGYRSVEDARASIPLPMRE